jgi:sulfotransferase family protein
MSHETTDKPDSFLLIIGAMKSGTTSLFEILKQHPEIAPCSKKEPDFYTTVDDPVSNWDKYLSLWNWVPDRHKIAMEASTSYTKAPLIKGVPDKISSSPTKNFKFIYMMRDPQKRITSQVRHAIYEGWGKSLDEEFTDDLIYFTQYAMQLDKYYTLFPKERFLLLTLEEFKSNPDLVLSQICKFLDISNNFKFKGSNEPRNTGDFYNIHPLFASLLKNPAVRYISDILIRGNARTQLRKWLTLFGKSRQPMGRSSLNDREAENIFRQLAPDLQKLSREYGVDIRKYWTIPEDIEL